MFKASSDEDQVIQTKTLFAKFAAEHNLPLSVADKFSDLVKEMFPDSSIAKRCSCIRTKATYVVPQTLRSRFDEHGAINPSTKKFSIFSDESNDQGDDSKTDHACEGLSQ